MLWITRKRVLALVAVGVLAVAAGAYAYFTSTGSGTATATVGSGSAVTIKGTVSSNLYPGGSSPVTFTVDNPSSGSQRVGTITLASITVDAGHSTCSNVITGGNPDFTMPAVAVNKTFGSGNGQARDADRDADDERHRGQPGRLPGRDADAEPDEQLATESTGGSGCRSRPDGRRGMFDPWNQSRRATAARALVALIGATGCLAAVAYAASPRSAPATRRRGPPVTSGRRGSNAVPGAGTAAAPPQPRIARHPAKTTLSTTGLLPLRPPPGRRRLPVQARRRRLEALRASPASPTAASPSATHQLLVRADATAAAQPSGPLRLGAGGAEGLLDLAELSGLGSLYPGAPPVALPVRAHQPQLGADLGHRPAGRGQRRPAGLPQRRRTSS